MLANFEAQRQQGDFVGYRSFFNMLPKSLQDYSNYAQQHLKEGCSPYYNLSSRTDGGFVFGFVNGLVDIPFSRMIGLSSLIVDPIGTFMHTLDSLHPWNPNNVGHSLERWVQNDLINGNGFQRGRVTGRVSGEVALIVAPYAYGKVVKWQNGRVTAGGNTYTISEGGGGITSTVKANGKTVTFGHGGRHLSGTGLDVNMVNKTLASRVSKIHPGTGQFYKGQAIIKGINIEYTSYGVSNGVINVGTYYPVK
jgi:hypothetical protein